MHSSLRSSLTSCLVLALVSGCSSSPAGGAPPATVDDASSGGSDSGPASTDASEPDTTAADSGAAADDTGGSPDTLVEDDTGSDPDSGGDPDTSPAADTATDPDTGTGDTGAGDAGTDTASADTGPIDTGATGGKRFVVSEDGLVAYEPATELLWQRGAMPTTASWSDARAYCDGLALGLITGFRLPRHNELMSLFDATATGPYVDKVTFPSTPGTWGTYYWTGSSTMFPDWAQVADLNSKNGDHFNDNIAKLTDTNYVRCVRGGTPLYQVSADGLTVRDTDAKITWQREVPAAKYSQVDAGTYCDALVLAGASDWRLPTIKELETLSSLYYRSPNPTIDNVAFPGTPREAHWSSTTGSPGYGLSIAFDFGFESSSDATNTFRVRCVR